MRISKLWSAVCAAAFLAGSPCVRAQDNPAQAAARAALMEKMSGPNEQPSPPTNRMMAPSVIVVTPSGAVGALPPETPLAPASANDTPAQAAARAALMETVSGLNAQQTQLANPNLAPIVIAPSGAAVGQPGQPANATTASPPPATPMPAETQSAPAVTAVPKTTPPPAAAVAPVRTPEPVTAPVPSADNSGFFTPVPPPSNPGIQAGVQPALQQKMSGSNQQPVATPPVVVVPPPKEPAVLAEKPAAPAVAPAVKPPPPANANYAGKTLGFKPIEAPPPPVSAQKQAELQALLARYMANQVSPEEYQKERAAILAGP